MKLKTFYVRAAAAAAAALLFLYPFPAHAADSAALQGQVSAAQREYESAASTLDSMQQQASDTRQQVNNLQSQTDALRGQLGSIVAQLEQSRTELAEAQNQATAAAKALEEKQAAFSARYDSCKQQLTAMQLLNEGGGISLLMQADDLYELLTFWQVLNDLTEHNKQLLDELDAEAQALDTQRQQAEAAAAQAAVTEEKRKAYEQATAALDAYLKAQSQKYQDPARHCSLDFTCPLPSVGRISTYFGEPDAVYNKPHTGADMPAASGTPIYAVADGVVSAASARPSYGNCVQIDHGTADNGSSYATLYAHMSSFCVSAGQTVHKGDVIGYVGNTGDVRGANGGYHLHLELRINGTRTDPLQYIPH